MCPGSSFQNFLWSIPSAIVVMETIFLNFCRRFQQDKCEADNQNLWGTRMRKSRRWPIISCSLGLERLHLFSKHLSKTRNHSWIKGRKIAIPVVLLICLRDGPYFNYPGLTEINLYCSWHWKKWFLILSREFLLEAFPGLREKTGRKINILVILLHLHASLCPLGLASITCQ